jgi:hypothetical protein
MERKIEVRKVLTNIVIVKGSAIELSWFDISIEGVKFEKVKIEGIPDGIEIERVGTEKGFDCLIVKSKEGEEDKECDYTTRLLIMVIFLSNVVRSSISIRSLIN